MKGKARQADEYRPSRRRVILNPGDVVRVYREMMELSQNELSRRTGLSQAVISGIERGKVNIGPERAKVFARVYKINPGLILFPQWEDNEAEHSEAA